MEPRESNKKTHSAVGEKVEAAPEGDLSQASFGDQSKAAAASERAEVKAKVDEASGVAEPELISGAMLLKKLQKAAGKKINALDLGVPTCKERVDFTGLSDSEVKILKQAVHQAYQRQYYIDHQEKAKEYQADYNKKHKTKSEGGKKKKSKKPFTGLPKKNDFQIHDIQGGSANQLIAMVGKVLRDEAIYHRMPRSVGFSTDATGHLIPNTASRTSWDEIPSKEKKK